MAQVIMPNVQGLTTLEEVKNAVGIMVKELTWLLQNLDTRNVNELNAEVIVAGSITAEQMAVGSITADKIAANAVTAEKIDVDELSAITANMGKLTSGEIYGAYIATREVGYPRAELNSTSDLIGAYASASNYIQVYTPTSGFSPTIRFQTPAGVAYITYNISENSISVTSNDADINISTQKKIQLFSQEGVYLPGWSSLKHNGTGHSLEDDFVKK